MSDRIWPVIAIAAYILFAVIGVFYLKHLYPQKRRYHIAYLALSASLLVLGCIFFAPCRSFIGIWLYIPLMNIITIEDLIAHRISNKILLVLLALGLLCALINGRNFAVQAIAPVFYGLIFGIISLVSRNKLGFGDAKLIAVISVFYGLLDTINVLFVASVANCLVGLIVWLVTRDMRREIPFAPALELGSIMALIWLI